jgi:hypothetical protein
VTPATIRPRFDEHRRRFAAAAELRRVERLVLDKRFTPKRSARLDRALVNVERKGAA